MKNKIYTKIFFYILYSFNKSSSEVGKADVHKGNGLKMSL